MLALALWEQPRSAGELWQGVDCGHCQRAAVVRARLTEIHVGFPQTQSLRLDRDAGGPTRPGPVAVISPDIASLSQKLSEALESRCHRRGVCTEIRELHWNLRGNVHSAVLYSWISTAARDQTTGRFSEKSETLGTEDRFSYCGRAIQGGMMGNLNTLPYLVNGSLRTLSKCLSAGPPTCHPSIHLTIGPSIICHPSTCTSPASTLRL